MPFTILGLPSVQWKTVGKVVAGAVIMFASVFGAIAGVGGWVKAQDVRDELQAEALLNLQETKVDKSDVERATKTITDRLDTLTSQHHQMFCYVVHNQAPGCPK